jgi:TonB family protein
VLALLAGVILWRSNDRHSLSPVVRAITAAPTTQEQINDYLARANIALATGRLAEPKGDNAFEFYQRVLVLQPERRDAQMGVQRTIDALVKRVEAAVTSRNARAASQWLAQLRRAQPTHPRLNDLRVSVAALQRSRQPAPATTDTSVTVQADQNTVADDTSASEPAAQTTSPSESAPTPATIDTSAQPAANESSTLTDTEAVIAEELSIATRLRERGLLVEPPGENAFERLLELKARSPESEPVHAEQQRLAFALLESARTALAANDVESADRFLKATDTLIPGMNTTRILQQQVDDARAQAAANTVIQAALLPRRREVPANYPLDARRNGIEGWVDVEFTITPSGDTADLSVREADPREVFEKAALDAVKHWKFEPIIKNGEAIAQRAVLRVRFTMADTP